MKESESEQAKISSTNPTTSQIMPLACIHPLLPLPLPPLLQLFSFPTTHPNLEPNLIQLLSTDTAAILYSPEEREKVFPYLEEPSMTAAPLQDAVHILLAWLHQHWQVGEDWAL